MLITEYEGKALLQGAGIAVPSGQLVDSPGRISGIPLQFPVAVKAQVSSGGRGKAGGIIRAANSDEAAAAAKRIFGLRFNGEQPAAVLIEPWLAIKRELYLSVTVDPAADGYVVLYSPQGGMDIEDAPPPARYDVGPPSNFRAYKLRNALRGVESDLTLLEQIVGLTQRLLQLAVARDCTTVEINPLVQTAEGKLVAADAKVVRDDYAASRAPDIAAAVKHSYQSHPEPIARALEGDLMLVWLDGDVGLISGGAGMTMATMDLIGNAGGKPACFLDCSNNPTPVGYRLAFDLLDRQPQIKVILVSIFGGLTLMDKVAIVMKDIMRERQSAKPVIFRLNGTNGDKIAATFASAGLINHAHLETAVAEAVELARKAKQ